MSEKREPGRFGRRSEPFPELSFDGFGHLDVDHLSARHADQVMMMTFQILGELESGTFTIGQNLDHHTGLFENRQVAVHAALGKFARSRRDLGGDERMLGRRENVDETSSTIGITLIDRLQTSRGDVVNIGSVLGLAHAPNVQAMGEVCDLAGRTDVLEDRDATLDDGCHQSEFVELSIAEYDHTRWRSS